MKKELVRLTSGSIVEMEALKVLLQENGIDATLRDYFSESLHAGFVDGIPNNVQIFIFEEDEQKAISLYQDYMNSNQIL